jgi:hypothetical protein
VKIGLNISGVRRKVVVGTVGVLAAGGAFWALGPSAASGSTHASTITLRYLTANTSFQGHVRSDTPDCMAGRTVTVYAKVAGPDPVIGTSSTSASGFYRVRYPITPGTYYSAVKKNKLPGYSDTVCSKATSVLRVVS